MIVFFFFYDHFHNADISFSSFIDLIFPAVIKLIESSFKATGKSQAYSS
jgi:hypothetical protein